MGQWWPAAGLGLLSVAEYAGDLLREVTIILIQFNSVQSLSPVQLFASTIVWPEVYSRDSWGSQGHPHGKEMQKTKMAVRPYK